MGSVLYCRSTLNYNLFDMPRILLIEPDVPYGAIIAAALGLEGYDVDQARSAQTAIERADAACPDIVVMELQLAAHNGLEFLYEFRSYADWKAVPVVVLSSITSQEFSGSWKLLTGDLGVKAYLYKPRASLRKIVHEIREQLAVRNTS